MNAFDEWVADTILELGGNPAEYLCGLARKRLLTYVETRVVDCQEAFSGFYNSEFLGFMPPATIAPTNLTYLH